MLYVERLERMAQNAILGGYGTVLRHRKVRLTLVMDCEQPYTAELHSRVSAQHGKRVQPITIEIEARCRKCFACKRRRSMFWQGRAMTEFQNADRTLFGTFSMSPEEHCRLDDLITIRLAEGRVNFNELSSDEIFQERVKEFGAEVTKWIKRVRKQLRLAPQSLRYLLIAEVHDSDRTSDEMRGRPHFHILLHERYAGQLVEGQPHMVVAEEDSSGEYVLAWYKDKNGKWQRKARLAPAALLKREWQFGHTDFQWAETANAASYVCKYLSKSMMLRVRASNSYGAPMDVHLNTPTGKAVLQTAPASNLTPKNKTVVRGERENGTVLAFFGGAPRVAGEVGRSPADEARAPVLGAE